MTTDQFHSTAQGLALGVLILVTSIALLFDGATWWKCALGILVGLGMVGLSICSLWLDRHHVPKK